MRDYTDYLIEPDGQVFSLKTNKYLKPNILNTGYCTVELFNEQGSKRLLLHRLVAQAYIPNPQNLPQVNHKDENRQNNRVENLEWCTAKYNMNYGEGAKTRHAKVDYTLPIFKKCARENGKIMSKPVTQYDIDGNLIARYPSAAEASRTTNLNHSHILECCNGKRYKTVGGYVWKFERRNDLLVSQY